MGSYINQNFIGAAKCCELPPCNVLQELQNLTSYPLAAIYRIVKIPRATPNQRFLGASIFISSPLSAFIGAAQSHELPPSPSPPVSLSIRKAILVHAYPICLLLSLNFLLLPPPPILLKLLEEEEHSKVNQIFFMCTHLPKMEPWQRKEMYCIEQCSSYQYKMS